MSKFRRMTALVMALVLLLSVMGAPAALAATGVNEQGRAAAPLADKLFIAIKNNDNATLNVVPLAGGDFTRVDTDPKIEGVLALGTNLFYLRNDPPAFQLIKTTGDGSALDVTCQWERAEVKNLSAYDDMLYCLVDNQLTIIDPETGDSAVVNEEVEMSDYVIVNDVVYYISATDIKTYDMPASGKTATATAGKLYSMGITGATPEIILDQGVSKLSAHGNYIYLHNLEDGYPTADEQGKLWIEGKLYRMNVQTNQLASMNIPYDWVYLPTECGIVVYTNEDVSLYPLTGGAAKKLMAPETYTAVTADATNAYVYEHTKGVLTQIPLAGGTSKVLYNGGPLEDVAQDTGSKGLVPKLDENGDPVLDEDGNPVYEESPENTDDATGDDDSSGDDTDSTTDDGDDDDSSDSGDDTSSGGSDKSNTYIFANSSKQKLTRAQILDTSKSYWRRARNEIYARHGYVFKDSELSSYFKTKSWYKPGGFSESDLNNTEWYNMELILSMEKEFGLIKDRSSGGGSSGGGSGSGGGSSTSTGRIKLSKNLFASSSTKKLKRSQVSGLSANKLAIARNEILARHGFPFQTSKWRSYFKGTGWKARSNFSYSQLNSIENYNIKLIKEYE